MNLILINQRKIQQLTHMLQFSPKDFTFIFTPISIKNTSSKPIQGVFTLQLEKGYQHIANLEEPISFGSKDKYVFNNKVGIKVKIFQQSGMMVSWSMYKNIDFKVLQFIDIFQVSLSKYFLAYIQQLRSHKIEYSKLLSLRNNPNSFQQNWRRLKSKIKNSKNLLLLKNSLQTFSLQCTLQISNQFDDLVSSLQISKKAKESKRSERNSLAEQIKNNAIRAKKQQQKAKIEIAINGVLQIQKSLDEFTPNALRKEKTILSDIIEASIQQSRHYTTQTNEKIPSNQNLLFVIEQQPITFPRTNSFHFQNQQSEVKIKRINSLQSPRRSHKIEDEQDFTQKQATETEAEGQLDKSINQIVAQQTQSHYRRRKYFIAIFLFIAFGIALLQQIGFDHQLKETSKKHKRKYKKSIDE